jgi:hypothetical protein
MKYENLANRFIEKGLVTEKEAAAIKKIASVKGIAIMERLRGALGKPGTGTMLENLRDVAVVTGLGAYALGEVESYFRDKTRKHFDNPAVKWNIVKSYNPNITNIEVPSDHMGTPVKVPEEKVQKAFYAINHIAPNLSRNPMVAEFFVKQVATTGEIQPDTLRALVQAEKDLVMSRQGGHTSILTRLKNLTERGFKAVEDIYINNPVEGMKLEKQLKETGIIPDIKVAPDNEWDLSLDAKEVLDNLHKYQNRHNNDQ